MIITREDAKRCVGPGWSSLIDKIYDKLPDPAVMLQVKEKFGGLRFYISSGSQELLDFIDQVEAESLKLCEQCGKPGVLRKGGWVVTRCDRHAQGRPPFEPIRQKKEKARAASQ